MTEEVLKHLLAMKISLAHKLIDRLPESVQSPVKAFEKQMMQVLYDFSKEKVERASSGETIKHEGKLKVIDVE